MLSAVLISGGLQVTIDAFGGYTVLVQGEAWLHSAPPFHLDQTEPLVVSGAIPRFISGEDRLGAYDAVELLWRASPDGPDLIATTFAAYRSSNEPADALRFTQTWLNDTDIASSRLINTSSLSSTGIPLGRFPSWVVPPPSGGKARTSSSTPQLNVYRWGGCQLQYSGRSAWSTDAFVAHGGQTSMPIVLYSNNSDTAQSQGSAVAIGPAGPYFFTAVHATLGEEGGRIAFAAGPMASLHLVPKLYGHSTLVVRARRGSSGGVNTAMAAYGAQLRALAGTVKPARFDARASFVLSHLGYWVDNGAPCVTSCSRALHLFFSLTSERSTKLLRAMAAGITI